MSVSHLLGLALGVTAGQESGMTLSEAKGWLTERMSAGDTVQCPCCTQLAKLYRRTINSGMARSLIQMYRLAGTDWLHVPTALDARSREEGKLAYWGLAEEEKVRRPDGGRAGYWRVTERGVHYVQDTLRVQKYALVFDGECYGMDGPLLGVRDALGTKFDYDQLMSGQ